MNFIGEYFIDGDLCDEIISFHKDSNNKQLGVTSKGVDLSVKDSTDVYITWQEDEIARKYIEALDKPTKEYIEEYKFCNHYGPWAITEQINIQHYSPNGAYHSWHTERSSNQYPISSRHLAFMTYLNDVNDGGETEFYYQNKKIKAEKGKTLIWVADWTHTHRGTPSPTQDKYIVTGWFGYTA